MKIKLAFATAILTASTVASCTSTITERHPFCAELVAHSDTCIEVADPVAQTGWLIHSDGTPSDKINYWLDGTIELH